jgi:hypothetical protein
MTEIKPKTPTASGISRLLAAAGTGQCCPECNGWGWIESDRCTCGTGPSGHYGMHEPHCGLEPCPRGCPFIPPAPSCGCPCGCPAPGKRDDDGTPGWCDPCRMNIHPVTAKTED